jgi:hypothetical protein
MIEFSVCGLFEKAGIEWFYHKIFCPTPTEINVSTDGKIPCPVVGVVQ